MINPTLSPAPTTPSRHRWFHPTWSPEHGAYVVLVVSFLTGAAAAQQWTLATTLAFLCAGCGFQAEHPWVLQIKQRRSWKPRWLVWGGFYTSVAAAIALYLYFHVASRGNSLPLLAIYGGAIAAFIGDALSVWHREQKSIPNEMLTFAAVSLSAPLAYVVTTGSLSTVAIGLWVLNTLFFSSAIFTVKLRKVGKQGSLQAAVIRMVVYHGLASLIVLGLWAIGWLPWVTALAFGVALLKAGIILGWQSWYQTAPIGAVAILETTFALSFGAIAAISLLPAHL